MMKTLLPLLLSLLLLCGCASQNPPPETVTQVSTASAPEKPSLCSPVTDDGITQRWMLPEDITGFTPVGQNLILFQGTDTTTLTLLDTQTMEETAHYETGFLLMADNATVQLWEQGISYFDIPAMETVVLDQSLRQVRRIPAPDGLQGMPLLSWDGRTLYYCTSDAIRAFDRDTGIHRILKEASYPVQGLSGLLLGDTVLQVSITEASGDWRTLFLSTETGQLLTDCEGNVNPVTADTGYLVSMVDGGLKSLLFGHADGSAMILHPRDWETVHFLGSRFQALTATPEMDSTTLDLYDLETGKRTAALSLPGLTLPTSVGETQDGRIWLLCEKENTPILLRWDPAASPAADDNQYTSPHFSRKNPDYDGLAACSLYAQELSERYGVEIRIYRDAVEQKPWDYDLEYEYQVPVLRRELERLDRHLGNFPKGFLDQLAEKFTALRICIVRSAVGSPASGSLAAVNGLQFRDGSDAYLVLCTDHDTEYALYHELCHLMDTVVLTGSTAYDRWDTLNPPDFQYDNDYLANRSRDGSPWLEEGRAYFIDTYSMSYAKEDRARILEYAMTEGHDVLFASPNLQAKLRLLCTGIREAFGLENIEETFLWEQYLLNN